VHWFERWLLPAKCVLTAEPAMEFDLSPKVIDSLSAAKGVCPVCAELSALNQVCGTCLKHGSPLTKTQVGYFFEGPLVELIHEFKYGHQASHARLLAELLLPKLHFQDVDLLVAVPIHTFG
jgi:predicted amidophosphoribosyltransferase